MVSQRDGRDRLLLIKPNDIRPKLKDKVPSPVSQSQHPCDIRCGSYPLRHRCVSPRFVRY
jgi:hypothetical protein